MRKTTLALLVSLALIPFLSLFPSANAAGTDLIEDFDDETPPAVPTEDWYTLTVQGTGSFRTSAAQSVSTPNSYVTEDSGTGSQVESNFEFTSGVNLCDAGSSAEWQMRVDTLPTATKIVRFGISESAFGGGNELGVLQFQNGGVWSLFVSTPTGTATAVFTGLTVVVDTWYHVILSFECSEGKATAYFVNEDFGMTADAVGAITAALDNFGVVEEAATASGKRYVDDLELHGVSPAVAAAATQAFTDITGFDIDPTGTTIVLRTDAGAQVRARSAVDFTGGGNFDTDCDAGTQTNDMVMVQTGGTFVGFVDCDALGEPKTMLVMPPSLNDLVDAAGNDIELDPFTEQGDNALRKIEQVASFPIDQSLLLTVLGFDSRRVAWGFSSTNSDSIIGIDHYTNYESASDDWNTNQVQFGTQDAADMCIGRDDASYYQVATDALTTKIYPVTFFNDTEVSQFDGPLRSVYGGPAFADGAVGVACGTSNVAIATANFPGLVRVLDRSSATDVMTPIIQSTDASRPVTLSEMFTNSSASCYALSSSCHQFVAYVEGTTPNYEIHVVNVFTEQEGCTLEPPSGLIVGLKFDRTAQNLWVVTEDNAARYLVRQVCTTATIISPQSGEDAPAPTEPVSPIFDTSGSAAVLGTFGANLFFGVLLIGMMAVGVGSIWKFNLVASGVGAALGLLLAWGFGFFNAGVVFAIIVLSGIVGFFLIRRGG